MKPISRAQQYLLLACGARMLADGRADLIDEAVFDRLIAEHGGGCEDSDWSRIAEWYEHKAKEER